MSYDTLSRKLALGRELGFVYSKRFADNSIVYHGINIWFTVVQGECAVAGAHGSVQHVDITSAAISHAKAINLALFKTHKRSTPPSDSRYSQPIYTQFISFWICLFILISPT